MADNQKTIQYWKGCFDSLCIYRGILEDSVIKAFYELLCALETGSADAVRLYCAFYFAMADRGMTGIGQHIEQLVLYQTNPFARAAEYVPFAEIEYNLRMAAKQDLDKLAVLAAVTGDMLCEQIQKNDQSGWAEQLPGWEVQPLAYLGKPDAAERLAAFHHTHSTGKFAQYREFLWDCGKLRPVKVPDPIRLSDFIGYENQRKAVVDNTHRLLAGRPANNVLLYGDRGTGKSSTVKAIGNEFAEAGLRLIELPKNQMTDFSKVLDAIAQSSCKFIIFIDDLAFENNEQDYTMLKALLEGGLSARPSNCVVYATSNRRNLIKETFRDRAGLASGNVDEEVHARDTMEEKLSLADRFGIRVTFSALTQDEYVQIVKGLARQRGITMSDEELRRRAIIWEMNNHGKSPRTARQFIDDLC